MLAGNESFRTQEKLDELLSEFEKQRFTKKIERNQEQPEVHLQLNHFRRNVFFDGACTRSKASIPIGTYGLTIQDYEGDEMYTDSGRVESGEKITNNVAESFAMLKVVRYLKSQLDLGKLDPYEPI